MSRKTKSAIILISLCFLSSGLVADNQPQKKVMNFIAVMDLKCGEGIKAEVCKALTDVIIDELVKTGSYTVIDRANRDKILAEQGFQQTGCVEENCTVEAGKLLGVGKIVVGSLTKLGSTYLINLQLVNVQTAAVETSSSEKCKCDVGGLIDTVRNAATKLMSHEVPPPAITPLQPSGPIPPITSPKGVGTLVITTNPPGAEVFLDALQVGKTPLTIPKVAEGLHQLTISLKGYVTLSKNIEVRANQSATVNEILTQQTGAIDIKSIPAGADCWVDGKYIGKTPRKISAVGVGKHSLKMTFPNYNDYTGETNVEANETVVVNAPLAGLPGRILVTIVPNGAEVYIDGKKAGITPYSGQLAPGSHQVRVSMNGYQSAEETVTIEPNKPKTLNLILKKGPDVNAYLDDFEKLLSAIAPISSNCQPPGVLNTNSIFYNMEYCIRLDKVREYFPSIKLDNNARYFRVKKENYYVLCWCKGSYCASCGVRLLNVPNAEFNETVISTLNSKYKNTTSEWAEILKEWGEDDATIGNLQSWDFNVGDTTVPFEYVLDRGDLFTVPLRL